MRTEEIERYLTRQMTDDERDVFEQELREQPQLREDVKIVAWTIEAIRERGRQEDAERIRRMREQMDSDSKRYAATVAAAIGGVLVVAAMTAISIPPLYHHVIKPVIESVFGGREKTEQTMVQQPLSTVSLDSLTSNNETGNRETDSQVEEEENAKPDEPLQAEEAATEVRIEQQVVKEEDNKEDTPKPVVADEKREAWNNSKDKQFNIENQNWMDENGTKYNPYSLVCRKGELILNISIVNNNEDCDINITDVKLLDESGNMHKPTKVVINSKTNKYHLKRTEIGELEIRFSLGTTPKQIQSITIRDAYSLKKGVIKNIVIN